MTDIDHPKNNEQWWYTSFIALSSGFGALVFFVNANQFRNIRDQKLSKSNNTIDDGDEESLFWLNAILGVMLLAIFVWSLMRMYMAVPKKYRYENELGLDL